MSHATREGNYILIRTGEKRWHKVCEERARLIMKDIARALSVDGDIDNGVQRARKREGLTQEELAEMVDVSRTYLSDIERGEAEGVTVKTAKRIASALEHDISNIF